MKLLKLLQMSDFKATMHQIQFPLALRPRPCWGNLQRSPGPLAKFKGPTFKGSEGKEEVEGGKEGSPLRFSCGSTRMEGATIDDITRR